MSCQQEVNEFSARILFKICWIVGTDFLTEENNPDFSLEKSNTDF